MFLTLLCWARGYTPKEHTLIFPKQKVKAKHEMIATNCYSGLILRIIHDSSFIFTLYKFSLLPRQKNLEDRGTGKACKYPRPRALLKQNLTLMRAMHTFEKPVSCSLVPFGSSGLGNSCQKSVQTFSLKMLGSLLGTEVGKRSWN